MKAQEFDRKFDAGEDISQLLDLSKAKRPRRKQQRIQLDLPTWMIEQLQREANRLGVTPQAIVETYLAERLATN
ncbi:MAG: CopG family transcriptional regulator [Hormoscilla sp. SP5CHS1]|nr:CopG family transcriptional regulator [Hormoscilla sp. SP12CHS1]MBC6453215.1 CopG family transcriptional regulator [Hormoscilla sp. SP5CHS1]MBC6478387.1 CopG family transcriptional regulator [Hormoscilla sp. GM7CHS1pb]